MVVVDGKLYGGLKLFSSVEIVPLDGLLEVRLLKLGKLIEKNIFLRKIVDKVDRPRLGKATSRHLIYAISNNIR